MINFGCCQGDKRKLWEKGINSKIGEHHGRRRRTWEENIKVDPKKCGVKI
jgi:hypothetical protein